MGRPVRPTFHARRETRDQRTARTQTRAAYRRELAELDTLRPRTRGDCHRVRLALVAALPAEHPYRVHQPCPFIGCRYHLHADVDAKGTLVLYDLDIRHTCALDVVDDRPEGVSREEIAVIARVTEERTRVAERHVEAKIRADGALGEWKGHESAKGDTLLALAAEGEG